MQRMKGWPSMNKKEYCDKMPAIAYYSGLNGVIIHGIEYDVNDRIICAAGAFGGDKSYHRVKIHNNASGAAFFVLVGHRVPLAECIRM